MKLFRNILVSQAQVGSRESQSSGITDTLTVVGTTDDGAVEIEGFYLTRQQLQTIRDNIDSYLNPTEDGTSNVLATHLVSNVKTEDEPSTVDEEGAEIIKRINQQIADGIRHQQEAGIETQQWVERKQERIENYSIDRQFKIDPRLVTTDYDKGQQSKDFAWKAELNLVTGLGQMILFAHGTTEEQARINLDGKVEDLMSAIACKGSKLEIASIRLAPSQIETGKGSHDYNASY